MFDVVVDGTVFPLIVCLNWRTPLQIDLEFPKEIDERGVLQIFSFLEVNKSAKFTREFIIAVKLELSKIILASFSIRPSRCELSFLFVVLGDPVATDAINYSFLQNIEGK